MNSDMKEAGCENGGGVTSVASLPGEVFGVFSPCDFRIRPIFRHTGKRGMAVCGNYFLRQSESGKRRDEFLETDILKPTKRTQKQRRSSSMKRSRTSRIG